MINGVSFTIWIALAVLCGVLASKKNRSFFGYFLLSIVLSPLVGFIAVMVMGNKDQVEDENAKNSETIEFEDIDYTELLNKLLEFYKEFELQKSDGYGNGADVYRNEKNAYFYIRQQGPKVILQTFRLPKYEEKKEEPVKEYTSNIGDLTKLAELYEKGHLTKEEFEAQKAKLLNV